MDRWLVPNMSIFAGSSVVYLVVNPSLGENGK